MEILKTRREFLCDFGSLTFVIALNDTLVKKFMPPMNNVGCLKIDQKDWQEVQIKACYLGVGSAGIGFGKMLSKHVGENMKQFKTFQDDVLQSSYSKDSWRQSLEHCLQGQDIVVLVGNVDDPALFGLRKFVISRVSYLWTIGILSEAFEMDRLNLHHEPNEILRLVRSSSSLFQDTESFIQSIFAIYLVQHKYIHDDDFRNICMEAFCELGI